MPINLLKHTTSNIELLEWQDLKNVFKNLCIFKDLTPNLAFASSKKLDQAINSFQQTRRILDHYESDTYYDFLESLKSLHLDERVFSNLKLLYKNKVFDLEEINYFILVFEFHIQNAKYIQDHFPEFDNEHIWSRDLKKFIKEFRYIMSPEGDINYLGHPKLAAIYNSIQEIENTIRDKIHKILNKDFATVLQYSNYDIINDHYVVPVRSDRFNNSLGEIISRSETGNTLYVQPFLIKEEVYNRLQLLVEMQNILYKINVDFNNSLQVQTQCLKNSLNFLTFIDEYNAKATLAFNLNLTEPIFLDNSSEFTLENLFHPLIPNCVPNTIYFQGKSIIISGPNTGGKTVTLKSITICCLLAHLGFYTPASLAKIPYFESIFFMANDNQDLSAGLSSFSAEISEFTDLTNKLNGNSLILIDEIFNSTSSDEASTLAASFFDYILARTPATICVSTHHELLKKILQKENTFKSCHVGFDFDHNRPTYRLHFGVPGSSLAHNIFKKLFQPVEVAQMLYDKSLSMLDKNKVDYNQLLEELNKKQTLLDKSISEYKNKIVTLKQKESSFEGELFLRRQKLENDMRDQASKVIRKIENILQDVKGSKFSSHKAVDKAIHNVKKEIPDSSIDKTPEIYKNLQDPANYIIGDQYFSTFIGKEVILKSIAKNDSAIVSKGNFTLKCPLNSLKKSLSKPKEKIIVTYNKSPDIDLTHDCRGMRLEEFMSLIENLTPVLISKSIPYLSIIHGHGDGVLKKWIRSYAKKNPELLWEAGANGNDGETKLTAR